MSKKQISKIALVIILSIQSIFAFANNFDALESVWNNTALHDTIRYNAIYKLTVSAQKVSLDKAITFGTTYLNHATKTENVKHQIKALGILGATNAKQGKLDVGKELLERAVVLAKQINDEQGYAKNVVNLGIVYASFGDIEKALAQYEIGLSIYKKQQNKKGILQVNGGFAALELKNGNYKKALTYYLTNLKISEELGDNGKLIYTKIQMGSIYANQGDFDKALKHIFEAIKLAESNNEKMQLSKAYEWVATIYREQNEFDAAVEYYDKAEKIGEDLNIKWRISSVNTSKSQMFIKAKRYTEAITGLRKSINLNKEIGDKLVVAQLYNILGNAYFENGEILRAEANCKESLRRMNLYDFYEYRAATLNNLSKIKLQKKQYNEAIILGEKAMTIAKESGSKTEISDISKNLYQVYKATGDYTTALKMYENYIETEDNLNSGNNQKAVIKSQLKYQYEKEALADSLNFVQEKLVLNEKNKRQNQLIFGGGFALFLITALSFFLFNLYNKVGKQNKIITTALNEKETLLREIHHRVKNNLQVVSSLLNIQGNKTKDVNAQKALQEGKNRVQSMSLIHQNLYQKDNLTGIKMKGYFEQLTNNLFETYNISKSRILLHTDIEDLNLDVDTVVPLGLIINELITNSLKYAFPRRRKANIWVSLKEVNNTLHLQVKDDGIGIENLEEIGNSDTFGYTLIKAFAEKLNGEVNITCENGTEVNMNFDQYDKV